MIISTLTKETKNINYPCLMVGHNEEVILFKEESVGTVVVAGGDYEIGYFFSLFEMDCFLPYHGTVTLKNG